MSRCMAAMFLVGHLIFSSSSFAFGFTPSGQKNWEKLYDAAGDALDKEDYSKAELAIRSGLTCTGGSTHKKIFTLELLAELYEKQKKYSEEEIVLAAMLSLMRSVTFPLNILAATYLKSGEVNYLLERYSLAAEQAQQALPILGFCYGANSQEAAVALNNLASAECAQNEFDKALKHFRLSLQIVEMHCGSKSKLYGMTALNLANTYKRSFNSKQATHWYLKASRALRSARGAEDPDALKATRQFSMSSKRTH